MSGDSFKGRSSEEQCSELEARLRRSDPGENGYDASEAWSTRLDALRELRRSSADLGADVRLGGINTHIHTAKSFSFFDSASDAAWSAYGAGVEVFGINDHYTIDGHPEFREACSVLGIVPTFSMEAVAMWAEAEEAGATVNDPDNPGRTYLTSKGVTRAMAPDSAGRRDLDTMNAALLARNREITARVDGLIKAQHGPDAALSFDDVLALTPHGQPTERHVSQALALWIERHYADATARKSFVEELTSAEISTEALADAASFQNFLRAKLIKSGGAAYVDESPEAFIPIERMVSLGLDLGAVPTYPVLGNPITPWEEDLGVLFDRLAALRIHAIEVIPNRNTRERLRDICDTAASRSIPVVNGTEHNTKSPVDLVDKFFFDDEFRPHFERGANVLLGHQELRARGEDGFVRDDGSLSLDDPAANLARAEEVGRALRAR
ncbi:MAG: hypothetical protein AAF517_23525 [Planctomycetota bacterium]